MDELSTTLFGLAVGNGVLKPMFAPLLTRLGEILRDRAEPHVAAFEQILERAAGRDANRLERLAEAPLAVWRDVLHDGSLRGDELSRAYYGGVLASSAEGVSRDDRGACFTGLVGRLSAYQVRAHFVLYSTWRSLFLGASVRLYIQNEAAAARVYLPRDEYLRAMGQEEGETASVLIREVLAGLFRESLVDDSSAAGSPADLAKLWPSATDHGLLFAPSALGAELFTWATGHGLIGAEAITREDLVVPDLGAVVAAGAQRAPRGPTPTPPAAIPQPRSDGGAPA